MFNIIAWNILKARLDSHLLKFLWNECWNSHYSNLIEYRNWNNVQTNELNKILMEPTQRTILARLSTISPREGGGVWKVLRYYDEKMWRKSIFKTWESKKDSLFKRVTFSLDYKVWTILHHYYIVRGRNYYIWNASSHSNIHILDPSFSTSWW